MSFNYRFSVIPAGAIIDDRLTATALRVLCLLGRHTNNQGWCSRSQVKMGRELKLGRSTVQDAIELLVETGWIEKRLNGRGSKPAPGEGGQPFTAHSYRVKLDREDLPARLVDDDDVANEPAEGAASPAGGAGGPAGGAAPEPAPLEGTSLEGISSEPEREMRAREKQHEKFAKWLNQFLLRWPTAAADDQARIANAARDLTESERDDALLRIPDFLEFLKRSGRKHPVAGWKYLEEKRWTLLAPKASEAAADRPTAIEGDTQWRIWEAIVDIARPRAGMPSFWLSGPPGARRASVPALLPEALLSIVTDRATWKTVEEGEGNRFAAWHRWLRDRLSPNLIMISPVGVRQVRSLRVPFDWPPRKDGTISGSGPPQEESSAA